MANWKEYTTKTTPEDADEIMIADSEANASKRTPFSGLWNWIANKLATAVISQLETQNKSIIPALNELNSKSSECIIVQANTERTKELKDNSLYIIVYSGINNGDINSDDSMHYTFVLTRQIAGRIGGIYNDSTVKTNMFSLDNNILKISTNSFWIRLHIRKL